MFGKLLSDLRGKPGGSTDSAREDEPGDPKGNGAAPALAPVALPAPPLLALLGGAFLPAAAETQTSTAQPDPAIAKDPTAETLPEPLTAQLSPGAVRISQKTLNPESGAAFASAASLPCKSGQSTTAQEIMLASGRSALAPAAPGPKSRAAAPASRNWPVPPIIGISPASSDDAEPAVSAAPISIDPTSAVPVSDAQPPDDPLQPARLAFAYRLTPAALHTAGPAAAGEPVPAASDAQSSNNQQAPPDKPETAPRSTLNHAAGTLPTIEPETVKAQEPAALASRILSDRTPPGTILPSPTRPAEPAGPAPRSAVFTAAPSPEPASPLAPPLAAHQIRLQLAGNSQRVDVRLTERAGEVQVAVRTPDALLAGTLREDLHTLSARLEQAGFRAEVWQPGGWAWEHHGNVADPRAPGAAAYGQEAGRQNHPQQQPQDSQRRAPGRESGAGKAARKFSGLLESLD